jgi:PilZ domain
VGGSERPARKSMRYPVKAAVSFRWRDADGHEHQGEGSSHNISETGAFVLAAVSPPAGADIELVISFVALRNAMTTEPVKLDGRVLRVEPIAAGKGVGGFAVLTEKVIFPGPDESNDTGNSGAN